MRALAQILISALCKSRKQLEHTAKSHDAPMRLGTLTWQADYQKLSSLYSNGLLLCVFIHEHLSGTKLFWALYLGLGTQGHLRSSPHLHRDLRCSPAVLAGQSRLCILYREAAC